MTMLRGKVIAEDGKFIGQKGDGRFLKREIDPEILRYPAV
jgi:dihydropyrimidinase